jgi:MinD-like ATPase involved in chromosome partitioning or flagellar assembly
MPQIISFHSFRRGAGKSTVLANVAALLAAKGQQVGVIDINLPAPSLHLFFGLDEMAITWTLNDFIWGDCQIHEAVNGVTPAQVNGCIHLIPASSQRKAIERVMRGGYYVNFLADACHTLLEVLPLDVLLLDTHAGIHEETQLAMALADTLVVIMRPDEQDYVGTQTTLTLAQRLNVPQPLLLVNEVPAPLALTAVRAEVERAFHHPVTAVIPHCEEMMLLGSIGLFVLQYEGHEVTAVLQQLTQQL